MFDSQTLARILKWTCSFVLVGLPLALIAYALLERPTPANASDIYSDFEILNAPLPWAFLTANIFSIFSLLVFLGLVFHMRKLFELYSLGRVLTFDAARLLQRIGKYLLAVALLRLVSHPILSLLLTTGHPEGQRQLSVAFTDSDLGFLIAAGFVFLVGKAMHDAAQNAEDIKGFI